MKTREQHIKDGTYRKDRHGKREVKSIPVDQKPEPPNYLTDHGKEEWNRLLDGLMGMKMMSDIDYSTLAMACYWYEQFIQTNNFLIKENSNKKKYAVQEYMNGKNTQNSQVFNLLNRSYKEYVELVKQFGVTPMARTRMAMMDDVEDEDLMENILDFSDRKAR